MNYERPNYFDPNGRFYSEDDIVATEDSFKAGDTNTYSKPHWNDIVAAEYAACREGVGIADYSSFTKMDLWSKGDEVVKSLQYLCSNDVDVSINSIIRTGMQKFTRRV